MLIGEICNRSVVTVWKDSSIVEAAKKMRVMHVGDVVVTEKDEHRERPLGILTDRDIVVEILAKETDPDKVSVADVMSRPLEVLRDDAELFETVRLMATKRVRRLPVVDDDGRLYGILTVEGAVVAELKYVSDAFTGQVKREQWLRDG